MFGCFSTVHKYNVWCTKLPEHIPHLCMMYRAVNDQCLQYKVEPSLNTIKSEVKLGSISWCRNNVKSHLVISDELCLVYSLYTKCTDVKINCYFSMFGGPMHMSPVTHVRHHCSSARPASMAERIFGGGFSPLYSDPFFGDSG